MTAPAGDGYPAPYRHRRSPLPGPGTARTVPLDCGHDSTMYRPPLPLPGKYAWCPRCRVMRMVSDPAAGAC